jgi:hypothetical protein
VDKPAAIVQMDGATFTCLPPPPFPSYVPPA